MTNKHIDKAKGGAMQAAGALTGDRQLRNEGRVDEARGSAKKTVDKVADALTGHNRNGK